MNASTLFIIPILAALCYCTIELLKKKSHFNEKIKKFYPLLSALSGSLYGVFTYLIDPCIMVADSPLSAVLIGLASGLSAVGGYEIKKKSQKRIPENITDNAPPRFYITGDKHRDFERLINFCKTNQLRKKDVIIILGDSGFNYYGDERDDKLKALLAKEQVTLFCLHGNKENRPQNIPTYGIRTFCNGTVYYEPKYPNLLFAIDGEVYRFNGKEFMVIGGAHSVDKIRCLTEGLPFWDDEMPNDDTKRRVEKKLEQRNHRIDGFLTHTCPISYLPTEMFVATRRNAVKKKKKQKTLTYPIDIDRSTEEWLETLMQKNDFQIWYCGHYHVDKELGRVHFMKKEILPFCASDTENSF